MTFAGVNAFRPVCRVFRRPSDDGRRGRRRGVGMARAGSMAPAHILSATSSRSSCGTRPGTAAAASRCLGNVSTNRWLRPARICQHDGFGPDAARPARVIALFCTGPFCPRYPVGDGQGIVLAPIFFCCDIRSHRAATACSRRRSGTVPLSSSSPFAFRFGTQPSFSAADNGRGTTGQQRRRWAAGRPS